MQINEYPITATIIKDEYLFDMDAEIALGVWQSQKVPWALINDTVALKVGTTSIVSGTNNRLLRIEGGKVGQSDYSIPKIDGTSGQALITNGAGVATWQTISTGITVGTTTITSGTNDRVLYQSGGVVSQSSKMTFNGSTFKLIGTDYVPTNNVFNMRTYTDDRNLLKINGLGKTDWGFDTAGLDMITIEPQQARIEQTAYSGLKIMSLSASEGYVGHGVGAYKFGIGANTPQARLDVRSQGALSTDYALRVRNDVNTKDLLLIRGNGDHELGATGSASLSLVASSGYSYPSLYFKGQGGTERTQIYMTNNTFSFICTTSDTQALSLNTTAMTFRDGLNQVFGTTTGTKLGTSTSQKIGFWNATPIVQPTTAIAGAAFISGGAGSSIKTDDTFGGYTLQQIAAALKNIGILA